MELTVGKGTFKLPDQLFFAVLTTEGLPGDPVSISMALFTHITDRLDGLPEDMRKKITAEAGDLYNDAQRAYLDFLLHEAHCIEGNDEWEERVEPFRRDKASWYWIWCALRALPGRRGWSGWPQNIEPAQCAWLLNRIAVYEDPSSVDGTAFR